MIRIVNLRNSEEIQRALTALEADEVGVRMMTHKAHHYLLRINSLNVPAANILKQEMLSIGGDAALHRGACDFSVKETPCLLMGTVQQYQRLSKKLSIQPFGLKKIGKEIRKSMEQFLSIPSPLKIKNSAFDFSKRPYIMGIVNVTPDSFSGDGLYQNLDDLLKQAEGMIAAGADILDIGGESTRPGSRPVSVEEEMERVIPAIRAVSQRFDIPISVDTSKALVARQGLECGAHLINDVSGLKDPEMIETAKTFQCSVVVMHNSASSLREDQDVMDDVHAFFQERLQSLAKNGIAEEKIILDPGIGFGKTPAQNFQILKSLSEFRVFGRPLLLGTSRKSFIHSVAKSEVNRRLAGSIAGVALGYASGFHIFRVHDVEETAQALKVAQAILEGGVQHG